MIVKEEGARAPDERGFAPDGQKIRRSVGGVKNAVLRLMRLMRLMVQHILINQPINTMCVCDGDENYLVWRHQAHQAQLSTRFIPANFSDSVFVKLGGGRGGGIGSSWGVATITVAERNSWQRAESAKTQLIDKNPAFYQGDER